MKKIALLFTLWAMAGWLQAQSLVNEFNHGNGKYLEIRDLVETPDSCQILVCPMFEAFPHGPDIGEMFYKVDREGRVTDSLLVENECLNFRAFFERDPNNADNFLYAHFDQTKDTVTLKMVYMDSRLNITGTKEIVFKQVGQDLCSFRNFPHDYFMDPRGDIIASYGITVEDEYKVFFARIGFDGTVKHVKHVPEIMKFELHPHWHTAMFSTTDLQYCYWGVTLNGNLFENPPLRAYVLDSLFNVVDEHGYRPDLNEHYGTGWKEHFVPLDSEHYLMTIRHSKLNFQDYHTYCSILISKYDRNHQLKKSCLLGTSRSARYPIRVIATDDNTVYCSYMSFNGYHTDLFLVCLDTDLNVIWERCIEYDDGAYWGEFMRVLENGDVAIGLFRYEFNPGLISVVVVRDEYDALEEQGFIVRPYAYWPNPAQDELHLRYSPDVKPTQVELYDLQGHLVRTQRNALESLNMQGLAPGTYTMRVTLEDGKVFTDKVVKE